MRDADDGGRRQAPNKGRRPGNAYADERAIDEKIGDEIRTVELDEQFLAGEIGRHGVTLTIPADTAVIIVTTVLAVQIVPGMGQADGRPGRVVPGCRLGARDVL